MKPKSIVLVLIFALLLIACQPVDSMGGADPCVLLSKGEAEKLLGESVQDPEPRDTGNPLGQKICFYSASSSPRFIQISVIRTEEMSKTVREHGQSGASVYQSTKAMMDPVRARSGAGR